MTNCLQVDRRSKRMLKRARELLHACLRQSGNNTVQSYFLHSQVRMMGMKNTEHIAPR